MVIPETILQALETEAVTIRTLYTFECRVKQHKSQTFMTSPANTNRAVEQKCDSQHYHLHRQKYMYVYVTINAG